MRNIITISIVGVLLGILTSCNHTFFEGEAANRCDTIFDVKGPVKSITYTVKNNFDDFSLGYYVSKVEYTPQGHRWNIIGNEKMEVRYFVTLQDGIEMKIVPDNDEALDGIITYVQDTITHKLKNRVIQYSPEYDGCELAYSYDGDKLDKVTLTDFIYNVEKDGFDYSQEIVFMVNDSGLDDYGNWTTRELISGTRTITINGTIKYYSKEEIPEKHITFQGDTVRYNEAVGDFNGDGILEKAWVNNVPDEYNKEDYIHLVLDFTDSTIRPVSLGDGYGFVLYNVGDINGDGCDEIGMVPSRHTSAWEAYEVWGSNKGKDWKRLLSFEIREELRYWERGEDFIPIQKKDDGTIEICEAFIDDNNDDFVFYYKTRPISIK